MDGWETTANEVAFHKRTIPATCIPRHRRLPGMRHLCQSATPDNVHTTSPLEPVWNLSGEPTRRNPIPWVSDPVRKFLSGESDSL